MFTLKLSKTLSLLAALTVTICTKTNADGFSLHQFPVSPNPGCWTIHLASACNCSTVTSSNFHF